MEAVPDEVVGRRSRPCPSSWSLSPALVSGLLRLDLLGFPKRVDMVPGADDEQPRVDKETTVEISVRVRGPSRRLTQRQFSRSAGGHDSSSKSTKVYSHIRGGREAEGTRLLIFSTTVVKAKYFALLGSSVALLIKYGGTIILARV